MLDQVKNELIHFTHSTRGRHAGDRPTVTIPTNTPGKLKTVKPAKSIHYLGVWLDSQLNSNEHIHRMTSKAMMAMYTLRILGNSIRGMHQSHARKIYIGAIQPITTYGLLAVFWKSKNRKNLKALSTTQNKCLCMITGAFKTTNIAVMEIKASIPPINIWLDHRLEMEALHISSLPSDHPIVCQVYPDQRNQTLPQLHHCPHSTNQRDTEKTQEPNSQPASPESVQESWKKLNASHRMLNHHGDHQKWTWMTELDFSSWKTYQESL